MPRSNRAGYAADFGTGLLAAILATPGSAPVSRDSNYFRFGRQRGRRGRCLHGTRHRLGFALRSDRRAPCTDRTFTTSGTLDVVCKEIPRCPLARDCRLASFRSRRCGWVARGGAGGGLCLRAHSSGHVGMVIRVSSAHLDGRQPRNTARRRRAILFATAYSEASKGTTYWQAFVPQDIARHVSEGHTVFVDVTADWCLTCKANKTLVLDRGF